MTNSNFQTLVSHWESLREQGEVPFRSQIDPRLFPEQLENIFILENTAPEQFRIRHSGMMLCEMMGFEVRGQNANAMMQNQYREKLTILLGQVLGRPGIAELTLVAQDIHDNTISLKMILLPLRDDFGDVSRVLGCISSPVVAYNAPLRFGIAGQRFSPIETGENLAQGFAESQAAFGTDTIRAVTENASPNAATTPKRGHLRLVTDNDQDT